MDNNFLAENKLKQLSADLSNRYTKCVAKANNLLVRYSSNFPDYTDHTLLHSVQVTNFCNELISDSISKLNEYELYVLLMSALLHDVGMGASSKEIEQFRKKTQEGGNTEYYQASYIRDYHHELSAWFILNNYKKCFIPNKNLALAIAEVSKGHRKTDLSDKNLYPADYVVVDDVMANLAYLAAVLRLADEMDISDSRNLMLQYAGFVPYSERSVMEFQKHRSVKCKIENNTFIVSACTDDDKEYDELNVLCEKLSKTYEYCKEIVKTRAGTDFGIQKIEKIIHFEKKEDLSVDVKKDGGRMTVLLDGYLNSGSAGFLENKLATRLQSEIKELVIDIEKLIYISSAGLRVILSAQKKMLALNGKMIIANTCDDIMEVFEMTGFNKILTFA